MQTQLEKDKATLIIARQELDWKQIECDRLERACDYGRCENCSEPLMFDEKINCSDYPSCILPNDSEMTISRAVEILDSHNKWRRGKDITMTNPTTLTEALTRVINELKKRKEGKPEKCQCKSAKFTRAVDEDFNPLCGRCGEQV